MRAGPEFPADFRLYLASQSPRRHSLLRELGIPYEPVTVNAREELAGAAVEVLAERNALAKARGAVLPAEASPGAFVLGSDTLVAVGDQVLGKPADADEARHMLALLAGRTHRVVSGVALLRTTGAGAAGEGGQVVCCAGEPVSSAGEQGSGAGRPAQTWVSHATTDVTFLPLSEGDIASYVASREWRGKAGGYAVQGLAALFVSQIEGEYSNVVGLPLCLLARLFREAGFDLLARRWLALDRTDARSAGS